MLPAKEMVRRAVYSKMGKLNNSDSVELCHSRGIKSVELALKQLIEKLCGNNNIATLGRKSASGCKNPF